MSRDSFARISRAAEWGFGVTVGAAIAIWLGLIAAKIIHAAGHLAAGLM